MACLHDLAEYDWLEVLDEVDSLHAERNQLSRLLLYRYYRYDQTSSEKGKGETKGRMKTTQVETATLPPERRLCAPCNAFLLGRSPNQKKQYEM
jgi:hypothetical protein